MMKISECFSTLQGEGKYTGVPSIFIRTSGCNLRCHWCDTPYTSWWSEGDTYKVDEFLEDMYKDFGYVKHVVISGGEPMIQKDLSSLVNKLKDLGHFVTIETNGTIFRDDVRPDLFSISPKLINSIPSIELHPAQVTDTEKIERAIKIHKKGNDLGMLYKFSKIPIDYQIKFVIQQEKDLDMLGIIIDTHELKKENVYLMPEGFNKEKLERSSLIVAELCKKHKFNYCPRVHIELWGDKRGV